eukprot:6566822-Pyramimonas_sp.AAC.1
MACAPSSTWPRSSCSRQEPQPVTFTVMIVMVSQLSLGADVPVLARGGSPSAEGLALRVPR